MARPLAIASCRSQCAWRLTDGRLDDEQDEEVFTCSGCGSEWVPSQPWTPIDHTGAVPVAVAQARRVRGRR